MIFFFGHAVFSLLAYICFILAFISGLLYLAEERQLKVKAFNLLKRRWPALDWLELVSVRLVVMGFFLLTLGIISGAVWSQEVRGLYATWRPKELLAFLTWLIYGNYLAFHHQKGFSRHRLILALFIGSALILLAFLGIQPWS